MTGWTEYRYAVVDVEGNGQQPPDLVELGAVPIVSGAIGKPVTCLCKPEMPITPIARRIHGIQNAMVAAAPSRLGELTRALRLDRGLPDGLHPIEPLTTCWSPPACSDWGVFRPAQSSGKVIGAMLESVQVNSSGGGRADL